MLLVDAVPATACCRLDSCHWSSDRDQPNEELAGGRGRRRRTPLNRTTAAVPTYHPHPAPLCPLQLPTSSTIAESLSCPLHARPPVCLSVPFPVISFSVVRPPPAPLPSSLAAPRGVHYCSAVRHAALPAVSLSFCPLFVSVPVTAGVCVCMWLCGVWWASLRAGCVLCGVHGCVVWLGSGRGVVG